jgi:hypothetical protein
MTEKPELPELPLGIDEQTRAYLKELRDYYAKKKRHFRSKAYVTPAEDSVGLQTDGIENAHRATAYKNREMVCTMLLEGSKDDVRWDPHD